MNCSAATDANPNEPPGLTARAFRALDLLAPAGGPLGVAVSGGPDSVALLVLAAEWAGMRGRRIAAATVDHGLRPEAAAEARGVKDLCDRLGIPHTTLEWRPEGRVAQEDARRARHGLLARWAWETNAAALAVGHTQDDRIETFLIRARAGSGWWGLAAPLPSSASPVPGGPRIVRPLLGAARQDLQDVLRARRVDWIEDPSNTADRFERARMRALAARLPKASRDSLVRSLDRLCRLRAAAMAEARGGCLEVVSEGQEVVARGRVVAGLGRTAMLRLLEALVISCGGDHPPPLGPLEAVCSGVAAGGGFAPVNVGGAWLRPVPARDGGGVRIGPEPSRRGAAPGARPDLGRAADLLADPVFEALS